MKKKVLVIGYFGFLTNQLDGQTVRTRNVYELIRKRQQEFDLIDFFDTQQFQKNKLFFFKMLWMILKINKLVYLPAHNNLRFIFPFIYLICRLKRIDILYIVIGGWLPEYLRNKKRLVKQLSNIKCIYPQSFQLRDILKQQYGFNNIFFFPNFRNHSFTPTFKQDNTSFKIVFMGRICNLKGIDVIFRLAKYIVKKYENDDNIIIDFYGPIDKQDKEYFTEEVNKNIIMTYKGILQPNDIYKTLCNYDVLVLPTKYPGEGFPGTILDAYISGLPVIVSNWRFLPEFIEEGQTGFVYNLKTEEQFFDYIDRLFNNRELLLKMKKYAHKKSKLFSADNAWEILRSSLLQ